QSCDDVGQRIGEVLVLTAAKTVARHDHARAIDAVFVVARGKRRALVRAQQRAGGGAAVRAEFSGDACPIERGNAGGDVVGLRLSSVRGTAHGRSSVGRIWRERCVATTRFLFLRNHGAPPSLRGTQRRSNPVSLIDWIASLRSQ